MAYRPSTGLDLNTTTVSVTDKIFLPDNNMIRSIEKIKSLTDFALATNQYALQRQGKGVWWFNQPYFIQEVSGKVFTIKAINEFIILPDGTVQSVPVVGYAQDINSQTTIPKVNTIGLAPAICVLTSDLPN